MELLPSRGAAGLAQFSAELCRVDEVMEPLLFLKCPGILEGHKVSPVVCGALLLLKILLGVRGGGLRVSQPFSGQGNLTC